MKRSVSAQLKHLTLLPNDGAALAARDFFETLFSIAEIQEDNFLAEKVAGRIGSTLPTGNVQIYGFLSDMETANGGLSWLETVAIFFVEHYFHLDADMQQHLVRWLSFLLSGDWRPKPSQDSLFCSPQQMRQHIMVLGTALSDYQGNSPFRMADRLQKAFNQFVVINSNMLTFKQPTDEVIKKLNSNSFKHLLWACSRNVHNSDQQPESAELSQDILTYALKLSQKVGPDLPLVSAILGNLRTLPQYNFRNLFLLLLIRQSSYEENLSQYIEITSSLLQNFLDAHEQLSHKGYFVQHHLKRILKRRRTDYIANVPTINSAGCPDYKNNEPDDSSLGLLSYYINNLTCIDDIPSSAIHKCLIIYHHIDKVFQYSWMRSYTLKRTKEHMLHILKSTTIHHKRSLKDNYFRSNVHKESQLILAMAEKTGLSGQLYAMLEIEDYHHQAEQNSTLKWDMSIMDAIMLRTLVKTGQPITHPRIKVMLAQIGLLNLTAILADPTIDSESQRFLLRSFG